MDDVATRPASGPMSYLDIPVRRTMRELKALSGNDIEDRDVRTYREVESAVESHRWRAEWTQEDVPRD